MAVAVRLFNAGPELPQGMKRPSGTDPPKVWPTAFSSPSLLSSTADIPLLSCGSGHLCGADRFETLKLLVENLISAQILSTVRSLQNIQVDF